MREHGIFSSSPCFFMGASTPNGFYGLFEELYEPKNGWRLYIITGGPGTGKSSLMKKIARFAEEKGLYCERISCSSDPDSLDAVILPSLKVSVADGTPPHILNEKFPGVSEITVDLGKYRNNSGLQEHRAQLLRLFSLYAQKQERIRGYLHTAGLILQENRLLSAQCFDDNGLTEYASAFCREVLGTLSAKPGKLLRRFLSANTYQGTVVLTDTLTQLCETVYICNDFYTIAAKRFLSVLCGEAVKRGYTVISCQNPMEPNTPQLLLLPELSTAIGASTRFQPLSIKGAKPVDLNPFYCKKCTNAHRNMFELQKKLYDDMLSHAAEQSQRAKDIHDSLERIYGANMNFDGVKKETNALITEIFGHTG